MQPAVFLDRDGTMLHDVGYLSRLDDLRWYPWTIDAVRLLNRAGFLVLVLTNQGGVALGLLTESFVERVHDEMATAIDASGGHVDGWFYCPHHPHAQVEALRIACDCRKPRPGMVRAAQRAFDIDLARSFVVGDTVADLGLAECIGARCVLVRTGHGASEVARRGNAMPGAVYVADDLMAATSWILTDRGGPDEAA
jgi:D-glycero-D-manno-heptose 1,7-bisphosphate phosphatase